MLVCWYTALLFSVEMCLLTSSLHLESPDVVRFKNHKPHNRIRTLNMAYGLFHNAIIISVWGNQSDRPAEL